jgi:asparagine synthetase B (glutamine-hydrolysing)
VLAGAIADDRVLVGQAQRGDTRLWYMGPLHLPLPEHSGGTLLGYPDKAAAYLLRRWDCMGPRFLDGVYGNYVVAIQIPERNEVVLAASPNGQRALAYYEGDGVLAYCSNLHILTHALGDRTGADRSLEDFFLTYGFFPFGRTGFRNVRLLPPGTLLLWKNGQSEAIKVERVDPWATRFGNLDFESLDEERGVKALYEAFMAALEEQSTDVAETAVLLGGFDSALVAAALVRMGKKVETFSFHYDDTKFNQQHTDSLACYLNTKHSWVHIDAQLIRSGLERYPIVFSQPSNWCNYLIQTAEVCRVIRERGYLHCYSGDGCDTVFLGYPRTHTMAAFMRRMATLPKPAVALMTAAVETLRLDEALGRPARVGLNLLQDLRRRHPARGLINFRVLDPVSIRKLRSRPPPPQELTVDEVLERLGRPLAHLTPDRLAYEGKALIGLNRTKIWSASDAAGVDYCSPYMHAGMASFARKLPDRLLRPEFESRSVVTGKYLLMKMAEETRLLPPEVIYQPKFAAVDAPVDDWFKGRLKDVLLSLIRRLPFETNLRFIESLFRDRFSETLYANHVSTDHITTHELSLLATHGSFYR